MARAIRGQDAVAVVGFQGFDAVRAPSVVAIWVGGEKAVPAFSRGVVPKGRPRRAVVGKSISPPAKGRIVGMVANPEPLKRSPCSFFPRRFRRK